MKLLKLIIVTLLLSSPVMAEQNNYNLCITKYTKVMTDLGKTLKPVKLQSEGWFGHVYLENGFCRVKRDKVKDLTIRGAKIVEDYRVTKRFQRPKSTSENLFNNAKTIFILICLLWVFLAWCDASTKAERARDNWINHWANK